MEWEQPDPAAVISLRHDADWDGLRDRYKPNAIPRPLERCLEVVRSNGARTAVVETRYIDVDYRSEYSSFYSKSFVGAPSSAHRLHFFGADVELDDLPELSERACQSYLGYMIVRPSDLGRVGRTMLAPPPDMANAVHTSVRDRVHFFGQELYVDGVPFAQQDTQFGRCAQVAAWICHHSGYLRGEVSRRAMADFSLQADPNVATGRPVPSQGLTGLQISNLMREFGLPPIVYEIGKLPASGQEPPLPAHSPDDAPGTWDTRTIAVVCRYLNSSYPVLIGNREHAFVLIGYKRAKGPQKGWVNFVRHDDQRGPYLWVNDILKDVDPGTGYGYSPWELLIAPVPEKLWLVPEAAERQGREYLLRYDELEGSATFQDMYDARELTFRTVAMDSSAYKASAIRRGLDSDSARALRLARFSRLIWVVEAVDRMARRNDAPSVLGELIFDSTSNDLNPVPLAIRVPGALLIRQTDGTIRSPLPSTTRSVRSAARYQP